MGGSQAFFRRKAWRAAEIFMHGGINQGAPVFVEMQGGMCRFLQSLFHLEKP